jgi:hypothetical protein
MEKIKAFTRNDPFDVGRHQGIPLRAFATRVDAVAVEHCVTLQLLILKASQEPQGHRPLRLTWAGLASDRSDTTDRTCRNRPWHGIKLSPCGSVSFDFDVLNAGTKTYSTVNASIDSILALLAVLCSPRYHPQMDLFISHIVAIVGITSDIFTLTVQ